MNFTDEQDLLRASVRQFVVREMPPGFAREWDQRGEPPLETYQRFADAGFMGIGIPEEYGGSGGGITEVAIVLEELARGMLSFATIVYRSLVHAALGFLAYGTEEQRREHLPKIASGESKFCFSLSEPDAGSDAAAIKLRAEDRGDHFLVDGQKMWSSGAGYSDYVFLCARTSTDGPKQAGISMLLVDLSSPGITIQRIDTLGDRASGTNMVFYDGVRVPRSNLLGELNGGWKNISANLEKERMASGPMSIGQAQAILDEALHYATTRVQGGKPIGAHQAVQHLIVNIAAELHTARVLTWDTVAKIARGEPARWEASITKLYCTEMLNRAAYNGMQVLGGVGYAMESDMQLHFRNARLGTIGAGSSEIQRNLLARELGLPRG